MSMNDDGGSTSTGGEHVPMILWVAITATKIVYLLLAVALRDNIPHVLADDMATSMYVALAFAVATLVATRATKFVTTRILSPIEELDERAVQVKVQRAVAIRSAFFESPALLGLVFLLLTGRLNIMAVFVGYSLALDLVNIPTSKRLRAMALQVHPKTKLYEEAL